MNKILDGTISFEDACDLLFIPFVRLVFYTIVEFGKMQKSFATDNVPLEEPTGPASAGASGNTFGAPKLLRQLLAATAAQVHWQLSL